MSEGLISLFLVLVLAAAGSALMTPVVLAFARKRGLYDAPSSRRIHVQPIPRLGGAAVFAAVVLALAVYRLTHLTGDGAGLNDRFILAMAISGTLMFVTGIVDDIRGLRPQDKIIAQVIAALIVFALGLRVEMLSLGSNVQVPLAAWASLALTIVWVVGVTNAFNLIDGLDGLATGIALVASITTLVTALVLGNHSVALVTIALIGALLGFLRYNFSPAKIFLGDSGSMFIGFMLAVLSVHGSTKSATAVIVVVPLCALAVPLLDVVFSIARRWLRGVPVSAADNGHIHHRLVDAGLAHSRAALILYAVAALLAMFGIVTAFAPPVYVIWTTGVGALVILALFVFGIRRLGYHEFAEAGSAVAGGFVRMRRVIRDQILAQDLASRLGSTTSLTEVDKLLRQEAATFGFLDMRICSANEPAVTGAPGERAWKLEYPLFGPGLDGADLVLRIRSSVQTGHRPYGAERVARMLAPRVQEHLIALQNGSATAAVSRSFIGHRNRVASAPHRSVGNAARH